MVLNTLQKMDGKWVPGFTKGPCLKNEERKPKQVAQFWPLNIS